MSLFQIVNYIIFFERLIKKHIYRAVTFSYPNFAFQICMFNFYILMYIIKIPLDIFFFNFSHYRAPKYLIFLNVNGFFHSQVSAFFETQYITDSLCCQPLLQGQNSLQHCFIMQLSLLFALYNHDSHLLFILAIYKIQEQRMIPINLGVAVVISICIN